MSDYSLELAAERITDARTKRYFSEVMTSYSCGCNRSAIVILWSVTICDILFKLVQLAEQYGDTIAKGILKDIEMIRVANPNSPEWEWKLVVEVKADRPGHQSSPGTINVDVMTLLGQIVLRIGQGMGDDYGIAIRPVHQRLIEQAVPALKQLCVRVLLVGDTNISELA